jgi:hypothetical protein
VRRSLLLLAVLAVAACDSSTPAPPTTADPALPTTTTTIPGDTCEDLAVDMAEFLDVMISVLNETSIAEFRDRTAWPEAVVALEQQGHDLDARSQTMECDLAQLQEGAFFGSDLDGEGPLSDMLLELLGRA